MNEAFNLRPVKFNVVSFVQTCSCAGGEALGWGLSFEVGLHDDGSDTDLTRAFTSVCCVKSSRRTCAAAPDNRWSNKKHDLSDVLLFD